MKREDLFYLIVVLTVLITRISVFLVPEVDIELMNVVIHHFWFGVILFFLGLLVSEKDLHLKVFLYGIGLGFVIDQLVFMMLGGGKDEQYWYFPSVLGTIVVLALVYPLRKRIIK